MRAKTIRFCFLRYVGDCGYRFLHLGYGLDFIEGMDFSDLYPVVFNNFSVVTIARV